MKKIFCFCMIVLVMLFVGCESEQKSSPNNTASIDGDNLLPVNAISMTICFNDYAGNATEPELESYQAYKQQLVK